MIARELSSFGIDLCFAPVLDIDHGLSQMIGDRAFSDRGDVIVELARAFRAGPNAQGLAARGKHSPSQGAVTADSHLDLPVYSHNEADIPQTQLATVKLLT